MIPSRYIVAQPVANMTACAKEGAASDDHGALIRSSFQHAVSARCTHHAPEPREGESFTLAIGVADSQVVGIVFGPATLVDEVRVCSLPAQKAKLIFDLVRRIDEVTPRQALF